MLSNTWAVTVPVYVTYLHAANRSTGTIRLHRHYLRHLATTVPRPWSATTEQLTAALAVPGWSAETRKSARSVVVSFYRWGHGTGRVTPDPSRGLPAISVPQGEPRPAPEAVLERALRRADDRERVMLLLAAYAGLRCAEVARCHRDDLVDGLLRVTGKGGKVRTVPVLHPDLVAAFTRADGYLFPGRCEGHLAPATVSVLLSEVLPDGWTGHTLRHRFGTRAYAGTRDLLAVGRALGHSRPETTQRYVQMPADALWAVVRAAA